MFSLRSKMHSPPLPSLAITRVAGLWFEIFKKKFQTINLSIVIARSVATKQPSCGLEGIKLSFSFLQSKSIFIFAILSLASSQVFSQPQSVVATARSAEFSLVAQSFDEDTAMRVVEITEKALDYFSRVMSRPRESETHFHYFWKKEFLQQTPDIYKTFFNIGKGFEIVGSGDLQDEKVKESLVRSSMTVFLQTLVLDKSKFKDGDAILYPPMWLVEGLTQGALSERHEKMEHVVQRAARLKKTPTLQTIQQWKNLSSSPTERFWQQSFCYWAVRCTLGSVPNQKKLCSWLRRKLQNPIHADYWSEKDEKKWQQAQTPPRRSPMMSWGKSIARLDEILAKKDLVLSLNDLAQLQLAAHWLLQPAITSYMDAASFQGRERREKIKEAQERRDDAELQILYARRRMDEIIKNYPIGDAEETLSADDEILERYAFKSVDNVFGKRLNFFEQKMRLGSH